MSYSLKWLFGLILIAALALGWWRSIVDAYAHGVNDTLANEVGNRLRALEERNHNLVNWMNFNTQDHEERIRMLEGRDAINGQIINGLIQDHEKRISEIEGTNR